MIFKELYKGIDSLYFSYRGDVKMGLFKQLEEKKQLARSEDEKEQALAIMTVKDHHFEVMGRGRGKYAYVLVDNWYHIQISASDRDTIPRIMVQISSDILHCFGVGNAMEQLRGIIAELLECVESETISRADIFVDFACNTDFEAVTKRCWVTWAEDMHSHWKGNVHTGWAMGYGGNISARLYNKTKEIEKSGKDYFKPIWELRGWTEGQTVWRLEFQLRREFLGQMSVNTFDDLVTIQNDIWRYCTEDWLRLAVDDGTENRNRWATHPVWQCLQRVAFGDGEFAGIGRMVDKSRIPSDATLFLNGMGYITAYAAREGHNDPMGVVQSFLEDAGRFLDQYAGKSKRFTDARDYLDTKLRLKKKKYNKE